jgi:glycosyltransferase involved in cell wall biosynthesis
MTAPSIAVVIPNRNDSRFLTECLNSVKSQSIRPDQIIFVDDDSTDDSLSIAHFLLDGIDGVTILSNPCHLGTMASLNAGLKNVSCDYVFFLASNDHLVSHMIERAKLSLSEIGMPGVWSARVWAADESGNKKYIYPSPVVGLKDTYITQSECIDLALKLGNWFTGTTLLFNSKNLKYIGGFNVEYQGLADLLAALTVSSLNGAVFCPAPLGVMRMHPGGYLFRTLTNIDNLESILSNIDENGPKVSKNLFTEKFCARVKDRFRFAAIRAMLFSGRLEFHPNWIESKYSLLQFLSVPMRRSKILFCIFMFILLRPYDIP